MNSVQLIIPKVAASEKEAIMSRKKFNDARRKAWNQNDIHHDFIDESKF